MEYGDMTLQDEAVVSQMIGGSYFNRDVSTASGTQAITGLGFRPSKLLLFMARGDTYQLGNSIGQVPTIALGQCVASSPGYGSDYHLMSGYHINYRPDNSNHYVGSVTSFDADGFTVSWTKTGSPTGIITTQYMAFK